MSGSPSTADRRTSEQAQPLDPTLVAAFLASIPDHVYFKDRDGKILAVSRSKALRHGAQDPAALIGKSDAELFNDSHHERTRREEETIVQTGDPSLDRIERLTWADGSQGWFTTSTLPLRNEAAEIVGTFGISQDITAQKEMEISLEKTKRQLIDSSHLAGMAEVATGVLHNVGNVLTSLNVSATLVSRGLRQSKLQNLAKVAAMLSEHQGNLGEFLTQDPKGRLIPEFIESLARHAEEERSRLLLELSSLQQNLDHIKEIVVMQQSYATMIGVVEPLDAQALMQDAKRMNAGALLRHDVHVVHEFEPVPLVLAEKAKVLQILVNLIRNAKYAADDSRRPDKLITLRIQPGPNNRVRLIVKDNGIGIRPETREKIFTHGFTTRSDGHGFGLPSSVRAAQEMNGTLTAHSDGHLKGATFTLELPAAPTDAQAS